MLYPLAHFIPSPNCAERPPAIDISLLVIHCISLPPAQTEEDFKSNFIVDFFQNKLDVSLHSYFETLSELKVSSHLLILRSGEIIQFVPLSMAAWHAGVSSFMGRSQCNDFSIGIELQGTEAIPYTHKQYMALVEVTAWLQKQYPLISHERICGHEHIAPGRKTDPGPSFQWEYYFNQLKAFDENAIPIRC